jgi:hypothetical protein
MSAFALERLLSPGMRILGRGYLGSEFDPGAWLCPMITTVTCPPYQVHLTIGDPEQSQALEALSDPLSEAAAAALRQSRVIS